MMHGAGSFRLPTVAVALLAAVLLATAGCSALSSDKKESAEP